MRPHDATDVLVAVPQLLGELQKLRDVMADAWAETQLIHAFIPEHEVGAPDRKSSDRFDDKGSSSVLPGMSRRRDVLFFLGWR